MGWQEGRQEGRIEESHRLLLRFGSQRLGPPDAATEAAVRAVRDQERLARMVDAVFTAPSWKKFLATP